MKTLDEKARFIELRSGGMSYEKIAAEIGVSKQTIVNWSKELRLEVSNATSMRMDEIYSALRLSKEKRLEVLGLTLQRLVEETKNRDFKRLGTSTILSYTLQFLSMASKEVGRIAFKQKGDLSLELFPESDPSHDVTWDAD